MTAPNVSIKIAADYKTAEQQGKSYLAKLEQDFRATMAQVKEDQARGLIDPLKAAQREADALKVKQTAILRDLNDLRTAGQLSGAGGTAFYTTVAGGLRSVGDAGQRAKLNLEGLIPAFNGLAARAVGLEQTFGTLAGTIGGSFSPAVTGAVLAGVAIIGLAYKTLAGDAKKAAEEAKKAAEDIAKSITDAVNAGNFAALTQQLRETEFGTRGGNFQDGLRGLREERARLVGDLNKLNADAQKFRTQAGVYTVGAVDPAAEKLSNRLKEIDKQINLLTEKSRELYAAITDPRNADLSPTPAPQPFVVAEKSAKAVAKAAKEASEAQTKALAEQAIAMHRYTEAAQSAEAADEKRRRAAVAALNDDALDKQLAESLKAVGDQKRATDAAIAEQARQAAGVVTEALTEGFDKTLDELHEGPFWRGVARDAGRAISEGVLQGLANGVAGGRQFWESLARLGENILSNTLGKVFQKFATTGVGQAAGGAAAAGFVGFDAGYATGTKGAGVGALAGAGAGAAAGALIGSVVPVVGTAIGAAAGALVGAIGGLVGAHKRAKDAAEKMAAAQESLAEQQRNAEANRLGLIGTAINDLTFRHLAATQGDEAAAAAQREAANNAEIVRLTGAGDQGTLDFARQVQAEEAARREKERAAAAADAARQAEITAGQQEAAEQARLKALADEAQALKDAEKAEADRVAQVNASAHEDQELRRLIATGQTDAAEAYRRTLEEQHRIDELIASGADAATIANERYVDGLEDIAAATKKAADAAREAAAAQDQLRNSQLGAFGQRNAFLGGTSPLDFAQTAALGVQSNSFIAQFLDGIDTSNPDSVIQALTGGFKGIDAGKLHEMTPEQIAQFTQALGIAGQIKSARPAIDLGPGVPAESQPVSTVLGGVTEGTAVRVDDILRSSYAVQVDQLDALRGILGAVTAVSPPNLPALGGGAGGGTFSPTIHVAIERLGVAGDGGASSADPRALARAIEGELAALLANPNDVLRVALIQTLGGAVDLRALASGDTTVRRAA